MTIKKGDTVLVLTGNDRGKTGEVLESIPSKSTVVVQGVNLRWRHKKPTQQNPKGERVQREFPVHVSNLRPAQSGKVAAKSATKKPTSGKKK